MWQRGIKVLRLRRWLGELESWYNTFGSLHFDGDPEQHVVAANRRQTGSFGTYPTPIRPVLRDFQERSERRPDAFIRYEYGKRLDESREAIAKYLHAPTSTCVFVPNATTGVNTALRNLVYHPGDVIIYFATIYGACGNCITLLTETTPVESRCVEYTYPLTDDELCARFEKIVADVKTEGKTPRIAVFDTIAALPGVRVPFERLTALCKSHSILSCIDGAHAVGHLPINLSSLDPDFFISNCHKWLSVPRGCAVFYVHERNQHLIRTTLPTSWGFTALPSEEEGGRAANPLPPSGKSAFVTNFEFVGTIDNSPYLCVPAAISWRSKIRWNGLRGEEAIFAHNQHLARRAGVIISEILGTEVMRNAPLPSFNDRVGEDRDTLGLCNFAMIRLPLSFQSVVEGDAAAAQKVAQWIVKALVEEYGTFVAIVFYVEGWWVRSSAEIYLVEEDFAWGGRVLKEVCRRVDNGEWKG